MRRITLERIDRILGYEENINQDFVIHIKNQDELHDLIKVLEKHKFEVELNLFQESLSEWMCRVAAEDKYDTCFRIRNSIDDRCVAWNPSIEHWRLYCDNIIEQEGGKIVFNEGKYTPKAAEIEADKIISMIEEGDCLKNIYGNMTKKQIIDLLLSGTDA